MKFNSEDIWHDIPSVKLTEGVTLPPGVFRFSLSDFVYVWKGFPSMSPLEKRNRLEQIFNADYFDSHTVLTDANSLEKLIYTDFYEPSLNNGSGFIYIYTKDTPTSAVPIILKWVTRYRNRPSRAPDETPSKTMIEPL